MNDKINPIEFFNEGGIPKNLLHSSKIDIEHLTCPICLNILWKPVACAQDRCFQSFCDVCITKWISQEQAQLIIFQSEQQYPNFSNTLYSQSMLNNSSTTPPEDRSSNTSSSGSYQANETLDQDWIERLKCPKCKRPFKKTSIPIIHNLLDAVQLNCIYSGCQEKPYYEQFQKHLIQCQFRQIECPGCLKQFLQSELVYHQNACDLVFVECGKCNQVMMRKDLQFGHTKDHCVQQQFENKDHQIAELQNQIDMLLQKNEDLEAKISKMWKGDFEQLAIYNFKTSFTGNYLFSNGINPNEVRLIRGSFNNSKQKNDFLHFYINHKIKTQSIFGLQWKVKITVLSGNLLLGICSTLCHYSIDFIINRSGEIKKKEWNENKYRHLRKSNFTFGEGDTLLFQFLPLSQSLGIRNETKHLICRFESSEIGEMGDSFYSFYSLETQGDMLQFL